MNVLPAFTCRCGAVVPFIDVWRSRSGPWESDHCSEACAVRCYPPALVRATLELDLPRRMLNVVTHHETHRAWLNLPEVQVVWHEVLEAVRPMRIASDPWPGERQPGGDIMTPRLLASQLTQRLRAAFPDVDVAVAAAAR